MSWGLWSESGDLHRAKLGVSLHELGQTVDGRQQMVERPKNPSAVAAWTCLRRDRMHTYIHTMREDERYSSHGETQGPFLQRCYSPVFLSSLSRRTIRVEMSPLDRFISGFAIFKLYHVAFVHTGNSGLNRA